MQLLLSANTLLAFRGLVKIALLKAAALYVSAIASGGTASSVYVSCCCLKSEWCEVNSCNELYSHLSFVCLLKFDLLTHDFVLHKFPQHLPPAAAQSKSSLHFGVHVVTCDESGQSGLSALATTTTANSTTISSFIFKLNLFCQQLKVNWSSSLIKLLSDRQVKRTANELTLKPVRMPSNCGSRSDGKLPFLATNRDQSAPSRNPANDFVCYHMLQQPHTQLPLIYFAFVSRY